MGKRRIAYVMLALVIILSTVFCANNGSTLEPISSQGERWGIYGMDIGTGEIEMIFGTQDEISTLRLNPAGDRFVFHQMVAGGGLESSEIFSVGLDGRDPLMLTANEHWDVYPMWSPDGTQIAFLSWRETDLDIYIMHADGGNQRVLYDSGFHDADIHWVGDQIVFTRESQIWLVREDGTNPRQLTDPPRAGEWGNAVLPFGDYDPRISPDGSRVVFSRMVSDESQHGNYDLYSVDIDGSNLVGLTDTGYTQGFATWSHAGDQIVYIVASIDDVGQYDVYSLNTDGRENRNITPENIPANFLIHSAIFSPDDKILYFIGQWWIEE